MSGTNIFKRAELQLRTVTVQNNLQHQKMKKTSEKVRKVIRSNHLTVREVEEEVGISKTTYRELITENLGIHRVYVNKELVDRANAYENFLKNIVTGDETWVYGYDVETKAHSSQWDSEMSPIPKKHGKFGPLWHWWFLLLLGRYSLWISTSWPDGEHGILSEGDEKVERGSEEKKAWFVEGEKWMLRGFPPF